MAIVNDDEQMTGSLVKPTVKISAPEFKSNVIDTAYTPKASLLTNVEGTPWTLNAYYSQVLGQDDQILGQQVSNNNLTQQYREILDMELRVTTPLDTSQVDDNKTMSLTGAANVFPFIIPNVGDMFTATIADGNVLVFQITSSEALSIFKETCYAISYLAVGYLTEELKRDFRAKTVDTLYYVNDFLKHGQNPLVQPEEYVIIKDLQYVYRDLVTIFFKNFYHNTLKTFVLPENETFVYDPFLTKFFTSIVDNRTAPQLIKVNILNCTDYVEMETDTVWKALAERSDLVLRTAAKNMGVIGVSMFSRRPKHNSIFYSGVKYTLFPKDASYNINNQSEEKVVAMFTSDGAVESSYTPIVINEMTIVNPVTMSPYVFSESFYKDTAIGQSLLEIVLNQYIANKKISPFDIKLIVDDVKNWKPLELFYYIPALIVIVKSSIRSF